MSTILVVEDEKPILELLTYNLVKDDHQVINVGSGEAALASARQSLPDLILLDLMLPGMDGLDACRWLKNDPETREIPVVILSARSTDADVRDGYRCGADEYLIKPIRMDVLRRRVKAHLAVATEEGAASGARR